MKRVNVYAAIREMREQIVKTMQERGIKELAMCMSYQEWGKEQNYEPDDYEEKEYNDCDYEDYRDQTSPYVIFFDKHCCGSDYRVDKVTLKEFEGSGPILEFECWANELGYDTFGEDDVVFLTLYNVYTTMYNLLEIKDEPEKAMVLYEVDEEDNTKTSIVAMKETDWQKRKPEAIEKVLREYFDERYADRDDEYFCYEDEIKHAVEALTTGYDTEFNGNSLFWDRVEMI